MMNCSGSWLAARASIADAVIIALSGFLAFLLRFEFTIPEQIAAGVEISILFWVVIKILVFQALRVDRGSWRYVSVPDVWRIGIANTAGSAVSMAVILTFYSSPPRSVFLLDFVLCTLATFSIRLAVRMRHDPPWRQARTESTPILVYGAGAAGVSILRELRADSALRYVVLGLIDDEPKKKGLYIQGTHVLGAGTDLPAIAEALGVEEVWIAIPSATGQELLQLYRRCQSAGLRCKTVPGLRDIIGGVGLSNQVRDVAVDDLLGRSPVTLDDDAIRQRICGATVVVTGAAGSIGSELCRQVARFAPAGIVAYEVSESALFHLEQEFQRDCPDIPFFPEIGNIQNEQRVRDVLSHYRPTIVFHAAAYKHVPLMETHVFEAVENNVFGTMNLAIACLDFAVSHFVMISSDKAVRPASIMGTTKRIAEILIRSLQSVSDESRFVSVRFGNVLGSNGSVVPIFKEQIARGGPVTVTHPDMRRYFMTIPEASQLVLQAFTMGNGGEIFVLDMGEPIRIVDLARNLILLSGLRPDTDIAIEFTGTRPGEKLTEELTGLDEHTLPTRHEKIKSFAGDTADWVMLIAQLERLREACAGRKLRAVIACLQSLVPEYNPSAELTRAMESPEVLRENGRVAVATVSHLRMNAAAMAQKA